MRGPKDLCGGKGGQAHGAASGSWHGLCSGAVHAFHGLPRGGKGGQAHGAEVAVGTVCVRGLSTLSTAFSAVVRVVRPTEL